MHGIWTDGLEFDAASSDTQRIWDTSDDLIEAEHDCTKTHPQ